MHLCMAPDRLWFISFFILKMAEQFRAAEMTEEEGFLQVEPEIVGVQ